MAGPVPPNPSELLSRKMVGEVMEELKKEYDFILIDTPPVGVVSDAATLSTQMDGAVFIVWNNFTKRGVAHEALRLLKASNVKLLGSILNDYDVSRDLNAATGYEYTYHYDPLQDNDWFTYTLIIWYGWWR